MDFVLLFVLAALPKDGFLMDILVPTIAGGAVILLILNSLLNHFGYRLW